MTQKHTQTVPIDIANCEVKLEITYTLSPGHPGCSYMPNGDPGYPPEPPELEYLSIKHGDTEVTGWLFELLCESDTLADFIEKHHENEEPDFHDDLVEEYHKDAASR